MTPAGASLSADWLTIVQSEMRALADDREVRETQAAVLDRMLDEGRGPAGAKLPGSDAEAGAPAARPPSGARDGDAGGGRDRPDLPADR